MGRAGSKVQNDFESFVPALDAHHYVSEEGIQSDGLEIHWHTSALQTCRIEDAVNQDHQMVRFFVNDGQKFALGSSIPDRIRTKQGGGIAFDEPERGVQFVRNRGDEIILELSAVPGKFDLGQALFQRIGARRCVPFVRRPA